MLIINDNEKPLFLGAHKFHHFCAQASSQIHKRRSLHYPSITSDSLVDHYQKKNTMGPPLKTPRSQVKIVCINTLLRCLFNLKISNQLIKYASNHYNSIAPSTWSNIKSWVVLVTKCQAIMADSQSLTMKAIKD